MSLPESQQPKGKTSKILPEAVKDPLMQAKLKLVEFELVEKLTYLKCISSKTADESKDQFCRLIDDIVSRHHQVFSGFKKFDIVLMIFFSQFFHKEKQYTYPCGSFVN